MVWNNNKVFNWKLLVPCPYFLLSKRFWYFTSHLGNLWTALLQKTCLVLLKSTPSVTAGRLGTSNLLWSEEVKRTFGPEADWASPRSNKAQHQVLNNVRHNQIKSSARMQINTIINNGLVSQAEYKKINKFRFKAQ